MYEFKVSLSMYKIAIKLLPIIFSDMFVKIVMFTKNVTAYLIYRSKIQ